MRTMTDAEFSANYAELLDAVTDDDDTAYLVKSPENARRLLAAIDRLEHGGAVDRRLTGGR